MKHCFVDCGRQVPPIFIMRPIVLEFPRGLMVPGADNQLEKFLLRVLSCNEMTAALRVNTLCGTT